MAFIFQRRCFYGVAPNKWKKIGTYRPRQFIYEDMNTSPIPFHTANSKPSPYTANPKPLPARRGKNVFIVRHHRFCGFAVWL